MSEIERIITKLYEEEIDFLDKVLERLKGYGCGYHIQLEKMINNRKKGLERQRNAR